MNKPNNAYKPVSILIVDDHALIRKGIMAILKNYNPNWELHEAEDGVKAILKAQEINPDIILLDYLMPRLDGVKAANIIRKARPESKIIMVSMDMSPEIIIEMIDADVAGIVSKHLGDDELLQAIDTVQNGKRHLSEPASLIITKDFLEKKKNKRRSKNNKNKLLTERETEILKYTVKGASSPTIARILSISVRTVSNHKASMFRKFKVKSTIELVRYAERMKIVPA
jgi:DNA-binding NarL/FixJ family response regulator